MRFPVKIRNFPGVVTTGVQYGFCDTPEEPKFTTYNLPYWHHPYINTHWQFETEVEKKGKSPIEIFASNDQKITELKELLEAKKQNMEKFDDMSNDDE